MIHTGDAIEVMRDMLADSVDAVVTDPPYGLEFMGKAWDQFRPEYGNWNDRKWAGKGMTQKQGVAPGSIGRKGVETLSGSTPSIAHDPNLKCRSCGHWRSGGTPCRCDNPDWEPRPNLRSIAFQAWCTEWGTEALRVTKPGGYLLAFGGTRTHHRLVCGLEDAGWIIRDELDWVYASGFPKGKANLKPAHEPIVLARKPGPLQPLQIDATRIGTTDDLNGGAYAKNGTARDDGYGMQRTGGAGEYEQPSGRWPSNVLLQDAELFDEPNPAVIGSGQTIKGQVGMAKTEGGFRFIVGDTESVQQFDKGVEDSGGYSRFFIIPKADRADREPVLRGQLAASTENFMAGLPDPRMDHEQNRKARENSHATVKPTDLMRHLVRLVTPPGGTVLDCFLGSGTTAIACELEGFPWIGIEKEPEYVAIAEARLNGTQRGLGLDVPAPTKRRSIPSDEKLAELGKTYQGHATFSGGWGWEDGPEEAA